MKNILSSKYEHKKQWFIAFLYCSHISFYDGYSDVLLFSLKTNLVFIKNPNQVSGICNVHLDIFYSNGTYFPKKLDKIISFIFRKIKHLIIIESAFNHFGGSFINPISRQLYLFIYLFYPWKNCSLRTRCRSNIKSREMPQLKLCLPVLIQFLFSNSPP